MKSTTLQRTQALLLVLVTALPAAHSFFWACNVKTIDLPTSRAELKAKIDGLFPARLYLRKMGNDEERRYSCITIDITGSARQDMMANRSGAFEDELDVMNPSLRADETLSYTAKLTFMESEEEDELTIKHTRVFEDDTTGITFEGVPVTMFQSDSRSKRASLTLTHLTDTYGVFDACATGFLGFSNTRSSYMLVNEDFDAEPLDYRCMAEGLSELTGVREYHPGGIC